MSQVLDRVIQDLSRLPGIGEKTATRLAFFILRSAKNYAHSLSKNIYDLVESIQFCEICQNFTDASPCSICSDPKRHAQQIIVVENPQDLRNIEKTRHYTGLYHVLHGVLSPLDRIGPEDLKIKELLQRLIRNETQEVILALNNHVESEATALYLSRLIKPTQIKLTQIATGVPVGGDLEYLDALTLQRAIQGRIEI